MSLFPQLPGSDEVYDLLLRPPIQDAASAYKTPSFRVKPTPQLPLSGHHPGGGDQGLALLLFALVV